MTTNRLGLVLLLLAALSFALVGCGVGGGGGGGGDTGSGDPGGGDPGGGDPGGGDPGGGFDLTGDWIVVSYRPHASSPSALDGGFVYVATATQSGTGVTVTPPDDGPDFVGSADGDNYTLSRTYPHESGVSVENVSFTLGSENDGVGVAEWNFTDATGSSDGGSEIVVIRVQPSSFDLNGTWQANLEPGFSDPDGNVSDPFSGNVGVTQVGNDLTIDVPGEPPFTGFVSGSEAWLSRLQPQDGGQLSEIVHIFFPDASTGNSEIDWVWWDDVEIVIGGDGLTLSR